jgi:hypothetical protein
LSLQVKETNRAGFYVRCGVWLGFAAREFRNPDQELQISDLENANPDQKL